MEVPDINYLDDPYCPVFGEVISDGLCIEVSTALSGGGLSIGAVPELTKIWDIAAARECCMNCPYSQID